MKKILEPKREGRNPLLNQFKDEDCMLFMFGTVYPAGQIHPCTAYKDTLEPQQA